ncbi:beta-glucosidase [Marasmius fiardii PR-910]|nr:beta-glucosidase [Marasmius fiardii PR-910]
MVLSPKSQSQCLHDPCAAQLSPEWTAAYTKAKAAVAKLSLKDKVNLGTGVGWMNGHCVGNTPAISSINFPGLCLQDGPLGIRFADLVSAFPAGINTATTWNRTLIRQRGAGLGAEFKAKGVNVALGPDMNMARAPAAGRNWEGFGGDPYLSGEAAFETITGVQSQGVQACAKHYINNEQEHARESSSSNQHEIYAIPFLRSVQANVASIMCSYINSSFACENDKMLNGVLKGEFAFPGYWSATHSTTSVNAGLDMTMPGDITFGSGTTYFGDALVTAVNNGQVSQTRIDDLATRILAGWYLLGQDSGYPAVNFDSWNANNPVNTHRNVQGNHKDLIRAIGSASIVLLRNLRNTLPLQKPKTIGIIGNGAGAGSRGPNGFPDRGGDDGVLAMGWGSGTAEFPYLINPLDAITTRARSDGTTVSSSLSDSDLSAARNTARGKDAAIVFLTADSGEGYITVEGNAGDRNDLQAWHGGDALVQAVASVNPNTVVAINSVGPIVMEAWISNPNGRIKLWNGLPGQEAGNALVDVLYGAYNPSGRLPYTIGKSINDYSAQVIYSNNVAQIPYSEESKYVNKTTDYLLVTQANIQPRFEFGFGLSYTNFTYSGLSISGSTGGFTPTSGPGSSLSSGLHEKVVTVSFSIQNSGSVAGHEVPQLYLTFPSAAKSAPRNLKGFDNIFITPGQSKTVTLQLSRFDFSVWNPATQRWEIPSGQTTIAIGASSRDIRLTGTIQN